MFKLLITTLIMMGLTFVIGFIVAAIIKWIAYIADTMNFYSSHRKELERLKKIKRMRNKLVAFLCNNDLNNKTFVDINDKRDDWKRGVNHDLLNFRQVGYYHGVSHGESKLDLLDYYYPDTKLLYLNKQSELNKKQKRATKNLNLKK